MVEMRWKVKGKKAVLEYRQMLEKGVMAYAGFGTPQPETIKEWSEWKEVPLVYDNI